MIRSSMIRPRFNIWSILSFIFIVLILMSNIFLFTNLFSPPNENWQHIKDYLLKDYIINSLKLVLFTGMITVVIGTSLAWLISFYDFPLRNFMKWALILPLAIPTNIGAYTYHGLLNYTGIFQSFLRNELGVIVNQNYVDIMNLQGAVFIFSMFLLPYVYTVTRTYMERQSASLIESARLLGRSPLNIFFTVIIPISRPAIIGGVSLVILEVLNDYGVVQYFGIPTFSTAIFKAWFGMGDINSAIRLSLSLLLMVFTFLLLERLLRGRRNYSYSAAKIKPIVPQKLRGLKAAIAFSYTFVIFSLAFLIPVLQLLYWGVLTYRSILSPKFWQLIANSLGVALVATISIIVISLVIANYSRISDHILAKVYSKITVLGYSIPGAVIAIGVMALFITLDKSLYGFYKFINPETSKLVLSMSIAMLIFAYVIRFLAIGFNTIQAGLEKIGKRFLEVSRTLGKSTTETFFKVDLPMLKASIIGSFVLIFVDILKELPLTLLLRPFNFDTLATKVYQYASDEMIHEAAVPSLMIILASLISIYLLQRVGANESEH